jgi:hypothetical protein
MSFTTYALLQTAVADWLNRTDLTSQIPDFITLAEAEMQRRLRRTTVRGTITISAEETTLAAAVAELRSIHLETGNPTRDLPLRIGTPEMVAERRARNSAVTGRPTDAAVLGRTLVVAPVPDQSYTARIVYYSALSPLSALNTSNAVLVEAPDAYLFGALLQAAPYLQHDERIPVWQSKFDAAIDSLNNVRDREEHSASIRNVRLPFVIG